jgi:hypothetical protein
MEDLHYYDEFYNGKVSCGGKVVEITRQEHDALSWRWEITVDGARVSWWIVDKTAHEIELEDSMPLIIQQGQ